jgi:hypothetical protein
MEVEAVNEGLAGLREKGLAGEEGDLGWRLTAGVRSGE